MKHITNSPVKISALVSIAVCLACAFAIFATGSYSSATLWKDFRILCASPPEREDDLLSLLQEAGLRNYVTEANSPFLPVQKMTPFIPFLSEAESLRSRLFFDERGEYRIVYIAERDAPKNYVKKLSALLEKSSFSWVLEQNIGFALIPSALLLTLALCAAFFCKPFPAMLLALLFPCLFAITGNSLSSWLSGFFLMCGLVAYSLAVFPQRRIVSRSQVKILSKNALPFFAPCFLIAFVLAFVSGRGLVFILAVPAGIVAAIVLAAELKPNLLEAESLAFAIKGRKRSHPPFKPLLMLSNERYLRKWNGVSAPLAFFAGSLALSAIVITAAAWLYGQQGVAFFPKKGQEDPSGMFIPAPAMYTVRSGFSAAACVDAFGISSSLGRKGEGDGNLLFSLSDFAAIQWNVCAYPWRKMSEPLFAFPHNGDEVKYKDYMKTDFGTLKTEEVIAARFDSRFIAMLFEKCSSPLEKMLIRQGGFLAIERRQLPI